MSRKVKLISLSLSVLLMLGALSGCGQYTADHSKYPKSESQSDMTWIEAGDEPVVLSNGRISFELDPVTTHFKVTNLNDGTVYYSVPQNIDVSNLGDVEKKMNSEVTVTYYQEQSSATYMFSTANCVDFQNQKVAYNEDTVRVTYPMSLSKETVFCPRVLDEKTYNKSVLDVLDDPNVARRLSRYYTLYDPADKADDFKEKAEKYSVLGSQALYILGDDLSDTEKEEISSYMKDAGYTSEQYAKLLEELGIEPDDEDVPVGFTVPIEYSLKDDGFSATVLMDKVEELSDAYKMQTVTLLEYFAACDSTDDGYYFVPDGSGALIEMNTTGMSDFSRPFYGEDVAVQKAEQSQLTKNLPLPVFGISHQNGGVFAIVESAAEVATLNVATQHNLSPKNHIYTDFAVRHMDQTDVGEMMLIPVFNLFSKHLIRISPSVRFVILDGANSEWNFMASYYRDYLSENKLINSVSDEQAIHLNYLCAVRKKASFIGISYQKKIILSTVKEIEASVKKLADAGVGPLCVTLSGYTKSGVANGVNNEFKIDKKVGTVAEVNSLKKYLEDNGGRLILDADYQFVYDDKSFDGYDKSDDSAHYLNRSIATCGNYNVVTRDLTKSALKKNFVSPSEYKRISDGFVKSAKSKLSGGLSVSYASVGGLLGGDYTVKKDIDRVMTVYLQTKQLKSLKEKLDYMTFENGNAYVLPYADALQSTPLFSSKFDLESKDVPFYEAVIHGSIPYSGTPQNLSNDSQTNYLRSAEYGASLSYTLITRENSLLSDTLFRYKLYSVSDSVNIEDIISKYAQFGDYLKATAGARFISNTEIQKDVFVSRYDNGRCVIVNYNDYAISADGAEVAAKSFIIQ